MDQALDTNGLATYLDRQAAQAADSLTDDPFVTMLAVKLAGGEFTGTSTELLTFLTPIGDGWRAPKGWPASARQVTRRLHRQAPVMRKAGWSVTDDGGQNHEKTVRWTIRPSPTRDARISDPRDPQHPQGHGQTGHGAGLAGVAGQESAPLV
jgi:hypothetical protein